MTDRIKSRFKDMRRIMTFDGYPCQYDRDIECHKPRHPRDGDPCEACPIYKARDELPCEPGDCESGWCEDG